MNIMFDYEPFEVGAPFLYKTKLRKVGKDPNSVVFRAKGKLHNMGHVRQKEGGEPFIQWNMQWLTTEELMKQTSMLGIDTK